MQKILLIFVLIVASCSKRAKQKETYDYELSGIVLNSEENPLAGVTVSFSDYEETTAITDNNGAWNIKIENVEKCVDCYIRFNYRDSMCVYSKSHLINPNYEISNEVSINDVNYSLNDFSEICFVGEEPENPESPE